MFSMHSFLFSLCIHFYVLYAFIFMFSMHSFLCSLCIHFYVLYAFILCSLCIHHYISIDYNYCISDIGVHVVLKSVTIAHIVQQRRPTLVYPMSFSLSRHPLTLFCLTLSDALSIFYLNWLSRSEHCIAIDAPIPVSPMTYPCWLRRMPLLNLFYFIKTGMDLVHSEERTRSFSNWVFHVRWTLAIRNTLGRGQTLPHS